MGSLRSLAPKRSERAVWPRRTSSTWRPRRSPRRTQRPGHRRRLRDPLRPRRHRRPGQRLTWFRPAGSATPANAGRAELQLGEVRPPGGVGAAGPLGRWKRSVGVDLAVEAGVAKAARARAHPTPPLPPPRPQRHRRYPTPDRHPDRAPRPAPEGPVPSRRRPLTRTLNARSQPGQRRSSPVGHYAASRRRPWSAHLPRGLIGSGMGPSIIHP